jgi:UDP-glucose 4-epimerase
VLQLLQAFELESGVRIPYEVVARRAGDVASSHTDVRQAQELFGWQARRDIHQMCADTWRWLNYNARLGQSPV